jgi:hypothetical protein
MKKKPTYAGLTQENSFAHHNWAGCRGWYKAPAKNSDL